LNFWGADEMALFTTGLTYPYTDVLGISLPDYLVGNFGNYTFTLSSPTTVKYYDDAYFDFTIEGSSLVLNAVGSPNSGTVNAIVLHHYGVPDFTITGMNVSFASLEAAISANDTAQFWSLVLASDDTINGSEENDVFLSGSNAGNDTLNGNGGDDILNGGLGSDSLNGGEGSDTLIGGAGEDYFEGGSSFDTISYLDEYLHQAGTQGIRINLTGILRPIPLYAINGLLNSTAIDSFGDTDHFLGIPESVLGTGFADEIYGYVLARGYSGNDTLWANSIAYDQDAWFTTQDSARLGVNFAVHGITANLAEIGSSGTVLDSFGNVDTIAGNVQNVIGTQFSDIMNGSSKNEVFMGNGGSDTLNGGLGGDALVYEKAFYQNVSLDGYFFNSVLETQSNSGIYLDFSGDSVEDGTSHGTIRHGVAEIDSVSGIEIVYATSLNNTAIAGADALEFHSGAGADNVTGGQGNDFLYLGDGNNLANGGVGSDYIVTGSGNDTVNGGEGTDYVSTGAGDDVVFASGETVAGIYSETLDGGSGDDTLSYSDAKASVVAILAGGQVPYGQVWDGLNVDKTYAFENIIGSSFNDILSGTVADNVIDGGTSGRDILLGLEGVDTVSYANSTRGIVAMMDIGGPGHGASWDGIEFGDDFFNFESITGSSHNDILVGDAGSNTLFGGLGDDTLIGGGGADVFRFTDLHSGADIIAQFEDGIDKLSFSALAAHSISDFTIYGNGTNALCLVLNGGDTITIVSGAAITIDAGDFIFM
jgi:Ca2+-binding RTX toxin-like protein